jgi:integrase/recombinase XerD
LHVAPFLRSLEKTGVLSDLRGLAPNTVHDYIIATSKPLTRASRKHLVSGLRSFLRFAHVNGLLERSLVEAVPIILTRKLERLPQTISWEAVQKLLAIPDQATLIGKRDYAILRLVASYGLRIGQAIHLRARDIDWRQGLIHFPAEKGCKSLSFPLLKEVAEALLCYLRERGEAPGTEEVFLAVRGPQRPLGVNNHLGTALQSYYRRAGIQASRRGAHPIRHAFATRLMEQGTPIKNIADLLGHRNIETTFLYTKVELGRLRTLAAEWPEVKS